MGTLVKKESIKSNFLFNILYQIVVLVIPLIQAPFLTRTLGDTSLGNYTYVNSIAYYFVIFAMLGIERHGQRLISCRRNDSIAIRKTFWSLFFVHVCISIISCLFYIVFLILFVNEHSNLFRINLIYVASALFNITFLFYGLETFRIVAIKNIFVKLIEFSAIFIFVKSPNDIHIYAFISCLGIFLGNILLLPTAIRRVEPIKFNLDDCKEHIKPLLLLSISSIAATLYTVFDKTLLGLLSSKEDVAYYEYANKIINVPKSFISVVGIVLFPKACALIKDRDFSKAKKISDYAILIVCAASFASIFGIFSIGKEFIDSYYGLDFSRSGDVLIALSPVILIIGLGDIVRNIFLIPMKKDIAYVSGMCINSVINILLSIILIPKIGIYGAVIGTIAAELFGLLYQSFLCRSFLRQLNIIKPFILFLINGLFMYGVIILVDIFTPNTLLYLFIKILIGIVCYILVSYIIVYLFYRDLLVYLFRRKKDGGVN